MSLDQKTDWIRGTAQRILTSADKINGLNTSMKGCTMSRQMKLGLATWLACMTSLACSVPVSLAGIMAAGDIGFTGFNADEADAFSIVTLVDVGANTTVIFDEGNWNGTSFSTSEGRAIWNSGGTSIAAGTVINFSDFNSTATVSIGSVSEVGNFNLNGSNEQLFAYLDATQDQTPDTFLAAISNRGFSPGTDAASTLANTGLTEGTTAVSFTGLEDIMAYNGPRSGQTSFSNYLSLIGNTSNWQTQNGTGDQSTDGSGPEIPFDSTQFTVNAVPEPASFGIFGTICLVAMVRRRQS